LTVRFPVVPSRLVFSLVLGVLLGSACGGQDDFPNEDELTAIQGLFHLPAPPEDSTNQYADNPAARDLGAKLYSDTRLSGCGTVSCQSCHPAPAYTVSTVKAQGCGGETARNPPSLLNTPYFKWFMWDGSRDSLWDQPMGPLLNPVEMASSSEHLREVLTDHYASDYEAIFGKRPEDEPDPDRLLANFGKVMEAYERTLIRVNSPFDQKLEHFITSANQGQAAADPFYRQLHVFVRRARCAVCHKGPTLSDFQFHDLGLSEGSEALDHGRAPGIEQVALDRFNSAGEYSDDPAGGASRLSGISGETGTDGAFKTPTLRNVALTGPYMHNGSLATLDDVIAFYNRGGDSATFAGVRTDTIIPLYLSDSEKAALKDLLQSLTGAETP